MVHLHSLVGFILHTLVRAILPLLSRLQLHNCRCERLLHSHNHLADTLGIRVRVRVTVRVRVRVMVMVGARVRVRARLRARVRVRLGFVHLRWLG